MPVHVYITFPSTYHAIRADRLLSQSNLEHQMLPVPRVLSSSCGSALRLAPELWPSAAIILAENGVQVEGEYRLQENGGRWQVLE